MLSVRGAYGVRGTIRERLERLSTRLLSYWKGNALLSLLIVSAVLVALPLLARAFPLGADPYFYLLGRADVFGVSSYGLPQAPGFPILVSIVSWFPFFYVLVPWLLAALDAWFLGCFFPGRRWLGVALFLMPMFVFRAANFEDDIVAFPLMLAILLCVIWPLDEDSNIKPDWGGRLQSEGILPLVIPLVLFWKGWFIFVGLLAALYLPRRWSLALSAVVAVVALAYFTPWSTGVSENQLGVGSLVFGCFPAIPGLVGILLGKVRVPEWLFKWLAFTVPLGLLVTRFVVLAAFPLAILFVLSWDRFKGKAAFPIFLVVGFLLGPLAILEGPPDPALMDCLGRFEGREVAVSWDLVYWSEYMGAVPVSRGVVKPFLTIRNWRENCDKGMVEIWAFQNWTFFQKGEG